MRRRKVIGLMTRKKGPEALHSDDARFASTLQEWQQLSDGCKMAEMTLALTTVNDDSEVRSTHAVRNKHVHALIPRLTRGRNDVAHSLGVLPSHSWKARKNELGSS